MGYKTLPVGVLVSPQGRKPIEARWVLYKNPVWDHFVGSPLREQIEQCRIIRLVLAFGWVRPVAAPNHPRRGSLDEGSGDR